MSTTIPVLLSTSRDEELLVLLQQQPHLTQVVVDANGIPVGAWISSANCSFEPLVALGQYLVEEALLQVSRVQSVVSASAYQLRPGLLVDLESYEVVRGQTRLRLTPCEVEILDILLQQPRRFVAIDKLIRLTRLHKSRRPKRSLQEVISELRKKLGEEPRQSRLLRCLDGKFYAIFPHGPIQPRYGRASGNHAA